MRKSDYEARFKKVAGGFVFQAPNPWLFGPGEHYLVSEAQQAEILELGRDYHSMVRVVVLILLFIGCPVGAVYLVSLFIPKCRYKHFDPRRGDHSGIRFPDRERVGFFSLAVSSPSSHPEFIAAQ